MEPCINDCDGADWLPVQFPLLFPVAHNPYSVPKAVYFRGLRGFIHSNSGHVWTFSLLVKCPSTHGHRSWLWPVTQEDQSSRRIFPLSKDTYIGLPHVANKNIRHPVDVKFQINDVFSVSLSMQYLDAPCNICEVSSFKIIQTHRIFACDMHGIGAEGHTGCLTFLGLRHVGYDRFMSTKYACFSPPSVLRGCLVFTNHRFFCLFFLRALSSLLSLQ